MVCYRQSNSKEKYNQNYSIKFDTESIKSSPCDYSDAFILVKGHVTVTANNDTDNACKNCTTFFYMQDWN